MKKLRIFIITFIITFIMIGGFVVLGMVEINSLEINNLKIKLKNLAPEIEEKVFVQISDIHFRNFSSQEKNLLKELKRISPDYIFITGDLVDWTTKNLADLEKFLDKIVKIPRKKIYLVFGNHEHRNRKLKAIRKILLEKGISILNNKNVFLEEEKIYLIGVDDPHLGFDKLSEAIEGIEKDAPKILLAHSPEIFRKVNFNNVLVLCGHTHGGQINLPFISNLILPLKYDKKYKRGLFGKNYKYLYVNKGIGWTFIPFRFRATPEIVIIKLKND
ncbi:MAG: metallophosphoesterase [Candidatus Pacebacteria bacterium]|nr:metallophosphoesterase [Candidatus Paceibacterota bacterium]